LPNHYANGNYHELDASLAPGSLLEVVEELVSRKESARSAMA